MKKLLLLVCSCILLSLVSCDKLGIYNLIGKWEERSVTTTTAGSTVTNDMTGTYWTFESDGTVIVSDGDYLIEGEYSYDPGRSEVIFTYDEISSYTKYSVKWTSYSEVSLTREFELLGEEGKETIFLKRAH